MGHYTVEDKMTAAVTTKSHHIAAETSGSGLTKGLMGVSPQPTVVAT